MNRWVAVAEVEDAAEFHEQFQSAPTTVAKDYDLSKAPTEHMIEFYVNTDNRREAERQFREAAAFVGQEIKSVYISPA